MKLQLQDGSLRLRVDERELAALLTGTSQRLEVLAGTQPVFALEVLAGERLAFEAAHPWRLELPRTEVLAYAGTLPRRDALQLRTSAGLAVDFEVDVRDSVHVRGPRRRS